MQKITLSEEGVLIGRDNTGGRGEGGQWGEEDMGEGG